MIIGSVNISFIAWRTTDTVSETTVGLGLSLLGSGKPAAIAASRMTSLGRVLLGQRAEGRRGVR